MKDTYTFQVMAEAKLCKAIDRICLSKEDGFSLFSAIRSPKRTNKAKIRAILDRCPSAIWYKTP